MNLKEEQDRLNAILRDLDLPAGRWALAGSGVMIMHGIERHKEMGDVDIFCDTRLWFDIMAGREANQDESGVTIPWYVFTPDHEDEKRRFDPPYMYVTLHNLEVNVFSQWRHRSIGNIDVATWVLNAQTVGEIRTPCVPLQMLLDWKEQVGRGKDQQDIELIKKYLEGKLS